jgi:quercetin dioxygenase-like cupin family protein
MVMKKIIRILFFGIIPTATACHSNNNQKEKLAMPAKEQTSIFPKGDALSADYFTGPAFLHPLRAKNKNNEFALGSVTFEPGARTIWHTHPKGQVLIVIEGEGFFQEKGKPAQPLKKGDVVSIPENTEHWHGASAGSKLVHIAITNYKDDQTVVWLKPVSDEDYNMANSQKTNK